MREIEFRVWDKLCNPPRMKSWEQLLAQYQLTQVFTGGSDYFVLMQFIGIKDIHGKKVFQGDIVKVKRENFIKCYETQTTKAQEFIGEIVWHENSWYIFSKQKNEILWHSLWMWNFKKNETDDDVDTMEIVGSRWDNPELAVIE